MNIENEILNQIRASISEAICKSITGYNSPLEKLIAGVIQKNSAELELLVEQSLSAVLSGDVRQSVADAASHKMAKVMISKMEGEIEKRVNDLRSNPATRAKIIVAIEKVISEIGKE